MMKNSAKQIAVVASLGLMMAGAAVAKSSWKIKATPLVVDPAATGSVVARWDSRAGLPDNIKSSKAKLPKKIKPGHALYLAKADAAATGASARVLIDGVQGITLNEIGWDIRTDGSCSATSPRFEIVTQDNVIHTIGCDSATVSVESPASGWERIRYDLASATPPIDSAATDPATRTVQSITIVLDGGQTTDTTTGQVTDPGFVYIDNIDINNLWIQKPGTAQAK